MAQGQHSGIHRGRCETLSPVGATRVQVQLGRPGSDARCAVSRHSLDRQRQGRVEVDVARAVYTGLYDHSLMP